MKRKEYDVMERQKYKVAYFDISYLFPICILQTLIETVTSANTGITPQSSVVTND